MYFLLAFHKYNDSFKRFKKFRRYRLYDAKTRRPSLNVKDIVKKVFKYNFAIVVNCCEL